MPTFQDPFIDADEAEEALRGLAHASRVILNPGDAYRVLGALSGALASLGQSLDQLADWHDRNADHARDDSGDRHAGRHDAETAAECLRGAAGHVTQARGALNEAFSHNGRIAWQPGVDTDLTRRGASHGQARRLAPPSAFGADTASRSGPHSLGR